MKVLGIVPARGGSKGVPRKNIRLLNGKPLLAYTAEAALGSERLSRTILSTEDHEIAQIGREWGLDVPFLRPEEFALDSSPTLPVVKHALESLKAVGETYDAVCLLQPTSPLRRSLDVDNCVELLERTGADSVISVLPVPLEYNPKWVYWQGDDGELSISVGDKDPVARRQDLPCAYHRDGSIYVTRTEVVMDLDSLYGEHVVGYNIPPAYSVNIDTEDDWFQAERKTAIQNVPAARI